MKKVSDNIKSVIIVLLVLFLGIISSVRLMEIQVVGSDEIVNPNEYTEEASFYTRNTKATRGEIVDFNNNLIVGNKTSSNIIIEKAFFPEDKSEGNKILLRVYNELKARGYDVKMSIPVTETAPYVFTEGDTEKLRLDLNLNIYATAENCIDKLISDYDISDDYTDAEKRIIAGLRYEMQLKEFSYSNDFILASDVDNTTVVELKELSNTLKGINATESAVREIVQGNVLPHEIGTVGPIYAEEYADLKDKGYALNDSLGKSGIESAMESELRGVNGKEEITVQNGAIIDSKTITAAKPGNTVKLTVDGNYQKKLQSILDNFLANFHNINQKPELSKNKVNKGAIVVLDAKTGALKGMATAPTYNLMDYQKNYEALSQNEDAPLVNRATYGLYLPGSTFKTITATAGLNEGIVDGNTSYVCNQEMIYHGSKVGCTGWHNTISVARALEVSCNIYFYELSDRLGIDNITKYAELYGLGQHTGIETGDAAGYLATPETVEANGDTWYIGYVLQAGIGNYGSGITPLQMACVANTIANEGVRYKPYLVDSLYDYGTENPVSVTKPEIAEQIHLNYDYVYEYIEAGMISASYNMPAAYSLSNLGFNVAIKTGTPQTGNGPDQQNSFFIGYAPADDPEVAFAGVIEKGEYSKYMIRDILLAYQECYGLNGVKPSPAASSTAVTGTGTGTASEASTAAAQTVTTTVQPNNQ